MTAQPAKTTKRKPTLRVVGTGPVLEEMERVLVEASKHQAPMISRSALAREQMEAEVAALEGELDGVRSRRDLARRAAAAVDESFQREEDDINRAIGLRTGGLSQDKMAAAE